MATLAFNELGISTIICMNRLMFMIMREDKCDQRRDLGLLQHPR